MNKTLYLVFVDKRFLKNGKEELVSTLSNNFEEEKQLSAENFFVISTELGETKVMAALGKAAPIFIDSVVPVIGEVEHGDNYKNITAVLESKLDRKEKLKIEALNLGSKSGRNAKSIEVEIGQALESDGFAVDLSRPDVFVYIILSGKRAFLGRLGVGQPKLMHTIDMFRKYNPENKDKISRAQFKLLEAIDYFDIDVKKARKAIDVGAAPGGWARILSEYGAEVVAIDSAELDTSLISNKKIRHIRKKADALEKSELEALGKADILLVDTNTNPEISANIAIKFADNLNKNGHLVLTIKLVDNKIDRHMNEVRDILNKEYSNIRLKKLPHNRLEITCFAAKR